MNLHLAIPALVLALGAMSSAHGDNAETAASTNSADTNTFFLVLGKVREVKSVTGFSPPPAVIEDNATGGVVRIQAPSIVKQISFSHYRLFKITNGMASEIATDRSALALIMDRSLSIAPDPQKLSLFYADPDRPSPAQSVPGASGGPLLLTVLWDKGLCIQEGSPAFEFILRQYRISLPTNAPPPATPTNPPQPIPRILLPSDHKGPLPSR